MTTVPSCGLPGTNFERTFIAVKPDGVQRGIVGQIMAQFEDKGFKLVALQMQTPSKEQAAGHYADLSKKPFFKSLVDYFASGPIAAMVWEGKNVIAMGRLLLGATNPADSAPGTIRGNLCVDIGRNICHGSDSPDAAKHEINFWFANGVVDYTSVAHTMVYEKGAEVAGGATPDFCGSLTCFNFVQFGSKTCAGCGPKKEEHKRENKKEDNNNKKADNNNNKKADNKKAENTKGGGKKAAPKKKEEPKKKEVKLTADGLDLKRANACEKEGGKKGQDIAGMATFGVAHFVCRMEEPNGEMAYLERCMTGSNKEVDPEGEDRKGGAGDLGKLFVSANETQVVMICHLPVECQDKGLSLKEWMGPVMASIQATVVFEDEFYVKAIGIANPEKDLFTIKMKDACIAEAFRLLKSKNLVLDDSDDEDYTINSGVNLNAAPGASY